MGSSAAGEPPPLRVVPPVTGRSDGLIPVRVAPLVPGEVVESSSAAAETVLDLQLILDYVAALAKRTAAAVKADRVQSVDQRHPHPEGVACLRCAVLGAARNRTTGNALLEVLVQSGADEEWNFEAECTDQRIVSRLQRLAISAASMQNIYGAHWGPVMLACLRIEAADFALLHALTSRYGQPTPDRRHTRPELAAYHLATLVVPSTSSTGPVAPALRAAVGRRLAVAVASAAVGDSPAWLDHLPAPQL